MGFLRVQADWNNRPSSVQQPTSTPANYELRQRGKDRRRKRWTAKKGDVGKEKEGGGGGGNYQGGQWRQSEDRENKREGFERKREENKKDAVITRNFVKYFCGSN